MRNKKIAGVPLTAIIAIVCLLTVGVGAILYWQSSTFTHTIHISVSAELTALTSWVHSDVPQLAPLSWFTTNQIGTFYAHGPDQQMNILLYGPTNIAELYIDVDMTGSYVTDGDPATVTIQKIEGLYDTGAGEVLETVKIDYGTFTLTGGLMDTVNIPIPEAHGAANSFWKTGYETGQTFYYLKLIFAFDEASLNSNLDPGDYSWDADSIVSLGDSGL